MRLFIFTLAVFTLAGCAAQHTPGVWVGYSFEDLQQAFGDPEAVLINGRANRVYVFREFKQDRRFAGTPLILGEDELVMRDAGCSILFEMAGPAVVAWDWEGDDCSEMRLPLPYEVLGSRPEP